MSLLVVSTGRNAPTKDLCIASVKMQIGGPWEHVYVESPPERTVLENLHEVVIQTHPDTIVVWLDGDDWLFSCGALVHVVRLYQNNPDCLLTYGQFVDDKGRLGFAAPYQTTDYRSAPWLATHLKTFRAGLFQQIKSDDLHHEGAWIPMASDQAVMLPMLEMAGPHRMVFCREPLVLYNRTNSHEATTDAAGRLEEQMWAARIRAKPRYGRLP